MTPTCFCIWMAEPRVWILRQAALDSHRAFAESSSFLRFLTCWIFGFHTGRIYWDKAKVVTRSHWVSDESHANNQAMWCLPLWVRMGKIRCLLTSKTKRNLLQPFCTTKINVLPLKNWSHSIYLISSGFICSLLIQLSFLLYMFNLTCLVTKLWTWRNTLSACHYLPTQNWQCSFTWEHSFRHGGLVFLLGLGSFLSLPCTWHSTGQICS